MASRWHKFDPTRPHDCLPLPGCYVFMHGSSVVYVGVSDNVRKRVKSHRIRNIAGCYHREPGWEDMRGYTDTMWLPFEWHREFIGKACYPRRYGEHLMIEARLIRRLDPLCNVRGKRRG